MANCVVLKLKSKKFKDSLVLYCFTKQQNHITVFSLLRGLQVRSHGFSGWEFTHPFSQHWCVWLTGIDLAFIENGFIYHTKYDTPDRILTDSIQRAGTEVSTPAPTPCTSCSRRLPPPHAAADATVSLTLKKCVPTRFLLGLILQSPVANYVCFT